MSGQLVLYVGKTKRLKMRECTHRSKTKNDCSSRHIPDYTDWTMNVLEETTDALGTSREQYFYDTLKPLYNYQRPGQTRQECIKTESYKACQKAYQKVHQKTEAYKASRKEYLKAYYKAYYLKKKLNSVSD